MKILYKIARHNYNNKYNGKIKKSITVLFFDLWCQFDFIEEENNKRLIIYRQHEFYHPRTHSWSYLNHVVYDKKITTEYGNNLFRSLEKINSKRYTGLYKVSDYSFFKDMVQKEREREKEKEV